MKKKIVSIKGGLGNQMFQYALCMALQSKGMSAEILITDLKIGHNGYELERLFDIKQQNRLLEFFYNRIKFPFRKIFLFFYKEFSDTHFIYQPNALDSTNKYYFYYGSWQSELYFKDIRSKILSVYKFNDKLISDKTNQVEREINNINCVSVHIRRGDYLNEPYKTGYGSCCTLDYYKNAIDKIKQLVSDPMFVFFSDDLDWVRNNFKIQNSFFVNHNFGIDSWQDMYLMSKCKHNIIANSSFSWWGAWLNQNESKVVIAPKRWWSSLEVDDVVPDTWIRL